VQEEEKRMVAYKKFEKSRQEGKKKRKREKTGCNLLLKHIGRNWRSKLPLTIP
jgi:hypothetical protein